MSEVRPWIDKSLIGIVGLVSMGAVTWCGYVTVGLANRPTKYETETMISEQAPYIRDKAMIDSAITAIKDNRSDMVRLLEINQEVIRENSRAIHAVEKQMVGISTILNSLVEDERARK